MARSRHRLTAEVQQTITAYIRAGGFPHVAAGAAGIPRSVFERWLRQGRQPDARPRYRHFHEAILQAAAQARIRAEAAVFKNRPLDWLRSGPARETAGNPGWTASARPAPPAGPRAANPLLQPEIQDLIANLLQLLTPFPEVRATVAGALDQAAPNDTQ
jgi:hypothetical protein